MVVNCCSIFLFDTVSHVLCRARVLVERDCKRREFVEREYCTSNIVSTSLVVLITVISLIAERE